MDAAKEKAPRLEVGPWGGIEEHVPPWERQVLSEFSFLRPIGVRLRNVFRHFKGDHMEFAGADCSLHFEHEDGWIAAWVWYPHHPQGVGSSLSIDEVLAVDGGMSARLTRRRPAGDRIEAELRRWATGLQALGTVWLTPVGAGPRIGSRPRQAHRWSGPSPDVSAPQRWDPRHIAEMPGALPEEARWEELVLHEFGYLVEAGFSIGCVAFRIEDEERFETIDSIRFERPDVWFTVDFAPASGTTRARILHPPFIYPGTVPIDVYLLEHGIPTGTFGSTQAGSAAVEAAVKRWAAALREASFDGRALAGLAHEEAFEEMPPGCLLPSTVKAATQALSERPTWPPDVSAWWGWLIEHELMDASQYLGEMSPFHSHGTVDVVEWRARRRWTVFRYDRETGAFAAEVWHGPRKAPRVVSLEEWLLDHGAILPTQPVQNTGRTAGTVGVRRWAAGLRSLRTRRASVVLPGD